MGPRGCWRWVVLITACGVGGHGCLSTGTLRHHAHRSKDCRPAAAAGVDGGQASDPWLQRVARSAQWHLAHTPSTRRRDCSGLVEAILTRAGSPVEGNSRTYWHQAERDGRTLTPRVEPMPGYLAFFDRTYDANRNGRVDDDLTHVAVVVAVEPDGTVVMVHRGSGRIKELRMNLREATDHRQQGRVTNDYLRSPAYGGAATPRLAAQLLRGYVYPPCGGSLR